MPRGRRKVAAKDYDTLIQVSEEKIQKLTAELKEEKANLKKLKKDKIVFDEIREKEEKEARLKKIAKLIETYGVLSSIPSKLLDIYRETDIDFRKVQWIIREVDAEMKKENNEKGMVFKLVPDEEETN